MGDCPTKQSRKITVVNMCLNSDDRGAVVSLHLCCISGFGEHGLTAYPSKTMRIVSEIQQQPSGLEGED